MNTDPSLIFLLEDNLAHVKIIQHLLKQLQTPFELLVMSGKDEYIQNLKTYIPDIIISDFYLEGYTGLDALELAHSMYPDLPFIIVSGYLDEEQAIHTMQKGASDIIMKDNMKRFLPAIKRELQHYKKHKDQEIALNETKERYRALVHSINGIVWEAKTNPFRFNYVSPRLKDILGFEVAGWFRNPMYFFKHVYEEDRERVHKFYTNFNEERSRDEISFRILNYHGRIVWMHDIISFHRSSNSKGVIRGMLFDISESKNREQMLQQTLKDKESLLIEVHHRVKNNLAVISGMLQLQAFATENKDVQAELTDSVNRIKAMGTIHEILYASLNTMTRFVGENLIELVNSILDQFDIDPPIEVKYTIAEVQLSVHDAVPCALIVNEVITNSIKHAFKDVADKTIRIHFSEEDNRVNLEITDNGIGLPHNFHAPNSPMTLGLTLINALTEQLGGTFRYEPYHKGTTFRLSFEKSEYRMLTSSSIG